MPPKRKRESDPYPLRVTPYIPEIDFDDRWATGNDGWNPTNLTLKTERAAPEGDNIPWPDRLSKKPLGQKLRKLNKYYDNMPDSPMHEQLFRKQTDDARGPLMVYNSETGRWEETERLRKQFSFYEDEDAVKEFMSEHGPQVARGPPGTYVQRLAGIANERTDRARRDAASAFHTPHNGFGDLDNQDDITWPTVPDQYLPVPVRPKQRFTGTVRKAKRTKDGPLVLDDMGEPIVSKKYIPDLVPGHHYTPGFTPVTWLEEIERRERFQERRDVLNDPLDVRMTDLFNIDLHQKKYASKQKNKEEQARYEANMARYKTKKGIMKNIVKLTDEEIEKDQVMQIKDTAKRHKLWKAAINGGTLKAFFDRHNLDLPRAEVLHGPLWKLEEYMLSPRKNAFDRLHVEDRKIKYKADGVSGKARTVRSIIKPPRPNELAVPKFDEWSTRVTGERRGKLDKNDPNGMYDLHFVDTRDPKQIQKDMKKKQGKKLGKVAEKIDDKAPGPSVNNRHIFSNMTDEESGASGASTESALSSERSSGRMFLVDEVSSDWSGKTSGGSVKSGGGFRIEGSPALSDARTRHAAQRMGLKNRRR